MVTDVINGVTQIVLESCPHNHGQLVPRKKRRSAYAVTKALLDGDEQTLLDDILIAPKKSRVHVAASIRRRP